MPLLDRRTVAVSEDPLDFVHAHCPAVLLVGCDETGWAAASVKALKRAVREQGLPGTRFRCPALEGPDRTVLAECGPTWVEVLCRCALRGSTPVPVRLVFSLNRGMAARWTFGGFLLGTESRLRPWWRANEDSVLHALVQQGDEAQVADSFMSLVSIVGSLERRERQHKRRLRQLEGELSRSKRARCQQDRVWEAFVRATNDVLTDALDVCCEEQRAGGQAVAEEVAPPPADEEDSESSVDLEAMERMMLSEDDCSSSSSSEEPRALTTSELEAYLQELSRPAPPTTQTPPLEPLESPLGPLEPPLGGPPEPPPPLELLLPEPPPPPEQQPPPEPQLPPPEQQLPPPEPQLPAPEQQPPPEQPRTPTLPEGGLPVAPADAAPAASEPQRPTLAAAVEQFVRDCEEASSSDDISSGSTSLSPAASPRGSFEELVQSLLCP